MSEELPERPALLVTRIEERRRFGGLPGRVRDRVLAADTVTISE